MTNPYYPVGYQPTGYYPQTSYPQQPYQLSAPYQQPQQQAARQQPQQVQQPQQQESNPYMIWVQGEVGEKSFNRPQGWPSNTPLPLWDSENPYVYLKSWDDAGRAKITRVSVQMEEEAKSTQPVTDETSDYVSVKDFEAWRDKCLSRDEFNEFKTDMYEFLKKNGFDENGNKEAKK